MGEHVYLLEAIIHKPGRGVCGGGTGGVGQSTRFLHFTPTTARRHDLAHARALGLQRETHWPKRAVERQLDASAREATTSRVT